MRRRTAPWLVAAWLLAWPAWAGELRVATSGTFTAAYLELRPALERLTRDTVVTAATSVGAGADSIPNRLARGEPMDVVIVADTVLEQLIRDGLVLADSRVDLARSTIGIAVRAGAARPDISTVDALRQTLLRASSIAYSASVSGQYVAGELFERLGIAAQVAPKSRRIETERVGNVVARGEAEIGFQQISELKPIAGIEIVGPLPDAVQRISLFSAGVVARSTHQAAARALIAYLASAEAAPTVGATGLEPLVRPPAAPAAAGR